MWSELFARAAAEPPWFEKPVELALRFTGSGKERYVPGSHVEALELELRAYGYAGVVRFRLFDDQAVAGEWKDELHDLLTGLAPIEMELRVRAHLPERERTGTAIRPLHLRALVGERTLLQGRDAEQSGRRHHVYSVRFYDPAYLLWRSHFPSELYTNKSVRQVLEANRPQAVALRVTSQVAAAARPMLFLGHSPDVRDSASFYDFLIWYTDSCDLKLYYDYGPGEYVLADAKPPPATPVALDPGDVAAIEQQYPDVPRARPRLHNICAATAQTQALENAQALPPLFQDRLLRARVAQEVEQRSALERRRLHVRKPTFVLSFGRLPVRMLVPGDFIELRHDTGWRQAVVALPPLLEQEAGRVRGLTLSLRNQSSPGGGRAKDSLARFRGRMSLEVEPQSEAAPSLPDYVTPTYPRPCEGRIVVDEGAENEEVYRIHSDAETSVETYRLAIPTWGNQEIHAPFEAQTLSGHFYFPAYKHETVLLALYFDHAVITGFVDWRAAGARVPRETQGNHLLMGKTADNNTSLRHIYQDNQPVFSIHRSNGSDHQRIELKQGNLFIQVREEAGKGA
jgi:hypothetical protein